MPDPVFYNTRWAAALIGCDPAYVRHLVRIGKLPDSRIVAGGRLRFRREDLESLIPADRRRIRAADPSEGRAAQERCRKILMAGI